MGLRIRPIGIPSGSLALLAVVCLVTLTAASCAWVGPAGQSKPTTRTTVKRVLEVARRGPIRVLLSYRRPEGFGAFDVFETRLLILRVGHRLVDDRLLPLCPYCAIDPPGLGDGCSLAIRDLGGDGHSEVLVDLGLGGAHNVPYTC